MAARFEYDPESKLLLITFTGEVRDPDLVNAFRAARRLSMTHALERGILDGTQIASFNASPEIVKSLAEHPPMFPDDSDRCIVVNEDYLFGMARMYQMLGGESRDRLRIVRSMQEAYEYLNIVDPPRLQKIE
ncbi:hypothetical protein Acid345_4374 [Candidatus Koribacter versatilis Ellin345]|uniref:Uncharacterized protein n=1 Tax=Koribacter versatilis (strain Ellin345) TaxID=204669 RepID=Q1IIC6_KORVE|nr:hypothetical protein [Candidatus Koribacter versatilis]ABF43374.1 hypothetical protein Acid345_4374 [Candidatus Koribacter versatilis Ellin345]